LSANPFHASVWRSVEGFADLADLAYHRHVSDATVRVAFSPPEVRNAFRPHTVDELTCSTTGWSASNCLLGSDAFGVYDR
jgi:1,4-dihydroxy-2-naphthoyl-CoA synthase